jgi:ABC-type antimicrobial peptide transport system permease subunit
MLMGIPWNMAFVRTAGDPDRLLNPIRQEFAAIDKELPVEGSEVKVEQQDWYSEPRFVVTMLVAFGSLGLVLVSVGVYSVVSYAVSRRTQEIGIRMALGAQATDMRRMVMTAGLTWLAIGIGIGVPASIALAKILQNRIWGIRSADPLMLLAVSLILTVVGLAACYFPARRATKVDPMVALRYE